MRAWWAWGQPYDAVLLPFCAPDRCARARFRAGPIARRSTEPRRFNTHILLSTQSPHNIATCNDEPSVQHDQERLHEVNVPPKARGVVDARVGRIRYGLAEEGAERRPAVRRAVDEQAVGGHRSSDASFVCSERAL